MEEKRTNLMPIVIIELIIIAALIGLLFYTMNQKSQDKCATGPVPQKIEEKQPEQKPEEKPEQKPEEKPTDVPASHELPIVTAFKEYYQKQNLADLSNIETWEFTTAKPVTNKKYSGYYEFSGYYICKDKTSDCVYLEQVGDPINGKNAYGFVIFAKVTENNGQYTFSDLTSSLD